MCLNHPQTIPPTPGLWKNCLPWNWSLPPKSLGTGDAGNSFLVCKKPGIRGWESVCELVAKRLSSGVLSPWQSYESVKTNLKLRATKGSQDLRIMILKRREACGDESDIRHHIYSQDIGGFHNARGYLTKKPRRRQWPRCWEDKRRCR